MKVAINLAKAVCMCRCVFVGGRRLRGVLSGENIVSAVRGIWGSKY